MKRKTAVIISVLLLIGLITVFGACYQPIIGGMRITVNYYDGETLLKSESVNTVEQALEYIPVKEGMEFKGWFLDSSFTVDVDALTAESGITVSLYAYFESEYFDVVFLDDNDNVILVNGEETQSIEYGSEADEPAAPEKEGFVFTGWSVAFDDVKSDLTIRPVWRAVEQDCELIFVFDSEELFSEEVEEGTALAAYANTVEEDLAIPSGFAFDGWFRDSELSIPVNVNTATVPETGITVFGKLRLLPIANLSLTLDSEESLVYSADLEVLLTVEFTRHDNITYACEWYYNEVGGNSIAGSASSINLEGLNAGAYTVAIKVTGSASGAGSASASTTVSFNVGLASLEDLAPEHRISAEEINVTYDGNTHRIEISGLLSGDVVSYALFGESYSLDPIDCIGAGVYNIGYKVERANYTPFEGRTTVTVAKAVLNVTAEDKAVVYGESMPSFTYRCTGFVGGDNLSVVSGTAQFECATINTLTIGQFQINVEGLIASDYDFNYVNGTLIINKRPLYITAADKAAAYGSIAPIFTAQINGFYGSDSASMLNGEISFDCEYTQGSNAGNYLIVPKGLSSDIYEMEYVAGNLVISKRSLTVTADNKTAYYGDNAPALTVKYSGFLEGDDESELGGELLFYCRYRKGNGAGTYPIVPSGLESANYEIAFVGATLTVRKVPLVITADNQNVTYGDNVPNYTVQYSGFITGENESKLTGELRFECLYVKGGAAGSYSITAGGLASNDYDVSYNSGNLTVDKKALSITADDKGIVYGDSLPSFSASFEGFIEGDSAEDLTGDAFYYCEYVQGSDTGYYDITLSNLFSADYLITFEQGLLYVDRAELTITAIDKSVIYGAAAPSYSVTYEGFKAGDGLGDLSGSLAIECTYIQGSPAGSYAISAGGCSSDNYEVVYIDGVLEVGKRSIEIKASTDFAYNGNAWEKSDWSGVTGLYGSDELTGTLKTISALAGVYTATGALTQDFVWVDFDISALSTSFASSYDIDYELSIEIKDNCFDYTANDANATYNGTAYSINVSTTLPSGVITYSENGVDFDSVNPSYTQAGTFTVYYKIADSMSYYDDITGTREVRIAKAALTVTSAPASTGYGQIVPEFESTITGYVNGEDQSVLGGMLAYDCDYEVGSDAGAYSVTPYGLSAENYRFVYVGSTLTVGKAGLTVTAADASAAYGDAAPVYGVSYDGFVAGDTSLDLSGTLQYNCGYIAGSALGSYSITPHGFTSINYQFTYVAGTLTVSAKNITVYAEDKETVYGSSAPSFSAASDDLFGSDTIGDISGLSFECDYSAGDDAGEYSITVSGGSNANYIIGYLEGTLTVTPKEITVTASDNTATYGTETVTYTIEASGLIAGDTVAMLGTPSFECDYEFGSDVGSYTITPTSLDNGNYSYTYADGTLTVTAKSAAVIWYGTDTDYYYNATNQGSAITPGITDIYGETIYTSLVFSGAGTTFLNAGNYMLSASLSDDNYTLTNTVKSFRMYKGEYSGITHRTLSGTYSPTQTLANIALDSNYFWATPGAVPTVPVTAYSAYYNADYDNYNNFALNVTVNLQKALASVTGSTVQEANYGGGAASLSLGVSYDGSTLSTSLYTFNYTNGNSFTAAGTYKTSVTITSDNFRVNATDCYMKVKGVLFGGSYYTIEDALNTASSGTVIVTTDTSFASIDNSCYNGSGYYTIKSGVQLLVPYSSAHSTTQNSVNDTSTALGSKYVRLTVPSGITLTVNGTLNVNSVRSYQSRSMGHTSGAYGELKLDEGSIVNLNNGSTLNSMGFVTGTGYINALSGSTVYDVLAMKDWRGGKVSYSIKDDYFAFNQYTMHNIEARLRIYYGSSMYCRYYVYTSVATVNEQMIVIGSGAVFQLSSGYLEKYMDASNGRTYLDLYGTMTTNSTTLELNSGIPLVGSFSINTSNKEFPLSGNYTMTMKAGSTGTVNSRFKLLPGAEFIVEQGATLNMSSSGRLYAFGNGVTFSNGVYTGTPNNPAYGGTACKVNTRTNNLNYLLTDNARIIINGTLNMAGYIGGLIETTGTTGTINLTGTISSTMKDRLNVTKVNTFGVDYSLEDVSFTAKGYLNGNTTSMVSLSQTTYHADTNGTNTWIP